MFDQITLFEFATCGATLTVGLLPEIETALLTDRDLRRHQQQVAAAVEANSSDVAEFDLASLKICPSGLLNVMLSIRNRVSAVRLVNVNEHIREQLHIMHLDGMLEVEAAAGESP